MPLHRGTNRFPLEAASPSVHRSSKRLPLVPAVLLLCLAYVGPLAQEGVEERRRVVAVDPALSALASGEIRQSISLSLFPDATFTGIELEGRPTFSGGRAFAGRLAEDPFGSMVLVVDGDVIVGTVRTSVATYRIRSLDGTTMVVGQVDESKFTCGTRTPAPVSRYEEAEAQPLGDDNRDEGSVDGDRAALEALYNSTAGENWYQQDNWLSEEPLSEWHGITVNDDGRVTELVLNENNLIGPLPDAIGDLSELKILHAVFNGLTGELPPSLGKLTKVTWLDLQWNGLSGPIPTELANMASLDSLVLPANLLSGEIPPGLSELRNLSVLNLGNNDLTGQIPTSLGNAERLDIISLEANSLSGRIPESFADLEPVWLDVDFNADLTGSLPQALAGVSRTSHLGIHGTSVCVPTDESFREWLDGRSSFFSSGIDCGTEPEATPVIDVAMFYTTTARERAGSTSAIEATVELMVAETNQAYEDSGVDLRIALVALEEVRYREANSSFVDLSRLMNPSDGYLDGVHRVRDLTGADLVHLVVQDATVCGIAWPVPRAKDAFAITQAQCGAMAFAHELGHSMGLVHDRYVQCRDGAGTCTQDFHYPYSFGYADLEARRLTIMAYSDRCADAGVSCRRVARFSNPDQTYEDRPLGIAGERDTSSVDGPADAVRALNNARHSVAAFRDTVRFVEDGSPIALGSLPDRTLETGQPDLILDVQGKFRDPNGDRLTFSAFSSGIRGNGRPVASTKVSGSTVSITPLTEGRTVVTVTATDVEGSNTSAWLQFNLTVDKQGAVDYDADGDRRIEIRTLAQLDAIRHDLNADGQPDNRNEYDAAFPNRGLSMGCAGFCKGYELDADLDFDTNGNGKPDEADDYWNDGSGWMPIAAMSPGFTSELDGNGHVVKNLYIDRDADSALFRRLEKGGLVRRVGLLDVDITAGGEGAAGLIVSNFGTVRGSYVTGKLAGSHAGGLAAFNGSRIDTSYASVDFDANESGGLVHWNGSPASIAASYATGSMSGHGGGLVNLNQGKIIGSYARASVPEGGGLTARGDGRVEHSYWDTAASGISTSAGGEGYETGELQAPLGYSGIYADWNTDTDGDGVPDDPWDFGTTTEYPVLSMDFDNDGLASWEEFGEQRGPIPLLVDVVVEDRWLTLRFSRELDGNSVPSPGDFVVRFGGIDYVPREVTIDGTEVRLELATTPLHGQHVLVSYTPDENGLLGVAGEYVRAIKETVARRRTKALVPLALSASDGRRQSFLRVVNHSSESAEVQVMATDDAGVGADPIAFVIGGGKTLHFNSTDLEEGSADKGLSGGIGTREGDWRLSVSADLDLEVLSYARTSDGFVTTMHDVAPVAADGSYKVAFFNPAGNINQASRLRMTNLGAVDASVTITGVDDAGDPGEDQVEIALPAGASTELTAAELESADNTNGGLGDGKGKWYLTIDSDQTLTVMNLLESPTGHLTNLSTIPSPEGDVHVVPLFPAASDPAGRQGFVRVVNRGDTTAEVSVAAFDETARDYEPLTLTVPRKETAHFNSDDLELGNPDKGLAGRTGSGDGDWRLELTGAGEIEVLSYVRTTDGFLTSMHDTVPYLDNAYRVAFFNPGSNSNQVSRLRLINAGEETANVTINAIDDSGASSTEVQTHLAPGTVASFSALELETGTVGLEGALGTGVGKWRLRVESDQAIMVMGLLESPTGHLTNLSN